MTAAWAAPEARLAGTGQVADDLYLIAHHDRTGRPRLPARAAGLALAGALLADLALAGRIAITPAAIIPAAVTPAAGAGPEDDPAGQALRLIAREQQPRGADAWLEVLGRGAAEGIAARLAAAGYLERRPARRPSLRAGRWAPADPDWAVMAAGRARRALDPARRASPRDTVLTALTAAAGLGGLLDQYAPPGAALSPDTAALDLRPGLRHLAARVRAAVDSAVLTRRA